MIGTTALRSAHAGGRCSEPSSVGRNVNSAGAGLRWGSSTLRSTRRTIDCPAVCDAILNG